MPPTPQPEPAKGTTAIFAEWVFPVDQPPIRYGVVEIERAKIRDVREMSNREWREEKPIGAIIPGLVNAHTHLEFSSLAQPLLPPLPFAEWIRSVIAWRRARLQPMALSVAEGLKESGDAGTTTLGEIATSGWTAETFNETAPRTVLLRESIALDADAAAAELIAAREYAERLISTQGPHVSYGFSPHAPYSVHPQLLEGLATLAETHAAPLAFHLAETREELELLRYGTGPLVELFRSSGFWREAAIPAGMRPLDYLKLLGRLPAVLIVHGNYLDEEEIACLSDHPGMTAVYCPRTHAFFGHPPHPWLRMLERGVRVALGTDGRCSNPDLSLWREAQLLREKFPEVPPALLLQLATLNGAEALGLSKQTGTLTPGKSADLAVVRLAPGNDADPHARLLHSRSTIMKTMRAGRWIAGRGGMQV